MNKKIVQKMEGSGKTRLDFAVSELFCLTRNQAQKAINKGEVKLNGLTCCISKTEVTMGDEVDYNPTKKEKISVEINIIYEDKYLLVINKPAGVTVHPAPGEGRETVIEHFRDRLMFPDIAERDGIVHRLDKGTSGLMIIAKDSKTENGLKKEFEERKVKKTYLALIEGGLEPEEGIIDIPIKRDENNREMMTVSEEGKPAVTLYKTVRKYKGYSLLELNPKTGRTHQIRVHLAALRHPIIGDRKYGGKGSKISRIFLHSAGLEFTHPITQKKVKFWISLPKELDAYLDTLN